MSETDLSFYVSIVSGALLTISEALPYLSQVKGNGIIQTLLNSCTKYGEQKQLEKQARIEAEQKRHQEIMDRLVALEQRLSGQTSG